MNWRRREQRRDPVLQARLAAEHALDAAAARGRVDERTEDTAGCPDQWHQHVWVRPTEAGPVTMGYHAQTGGVVEITEEALAKILRTAGYQPQEQHR